jgi:O-antigen/teichoic acid export membrane protein
MSRTLVEVTQDSLLAIVVHLAPRLANVLLFTFIGRRAGPSEAGIFALATTYLVVTTTFLRGLDDLVTRQVSREPDEAPRYLISFLTLRFSLAALLYGVLLYITLVALDYAPSTAVPVIILTASLVPDSLAYTAQAVLVGCRRFAPPAIAMGFASALKVIAGGWLLSHGSSLQWVTWAWFVGSMLGMALLLIVAIDEVGLSRRSDWLDHRPVTHNWRAAFSFLTITILMALEGQADTILLSTYHNETEVGWYNAAKTVAFSLTLLSQAYRMSIYPLMARHGTRAPAKLSRLYQRSMRYLGALILPVVAGVAVLSPRIVPLVFGSGFSPTATALRILIPTLVFVFLNVPNSRMMLVHDRQGWSSRFLLLSVAVNLLMNLLLDPSWGAKGAAAARLCSSSTYFLLNLVYVHRVLERSNLFRLLSRSVLATAIMAGVVWLVRGWPLTFSIGTGAMIYTGALGLSGGILPEDLALLRQTVADLSNGQRLRSKG